MGIVTVNIPILRPLVTRGFWTGSFTPSSAATRGGTSKGHRTIPGHKYEMTHSIKGSDRPVSDGGSEDFIIVNKGVTVQTSYEVTTDLERGQWSNDTPAYGVGGTSKATVNGKEI